MMIRYPKRDFDSFPRGIRTEGYLAGDTSFFELIFDGNDFYDLPAFTSDFDFEFDLNLASGGGPGTEQDILRLAELSPNILTLNYYTDGPELDLETPAEAVIYSADLVGAYHVVRIRKAGAAFSMFVDGILIGSFTDAAIDPTAWTTRRLSAAASGILANGKIKNWNGFLAWPPAIGGVLKVYQDAAKTTEVSADGQFIAVIETPGGDVVQATGANQGTIEIL